MDTVIVNITIDTETEEVQVLVSKEYNNLRVMNLLNIFFISTIKKKIAGFRKEINKIGKEDRNVRKRIGVAETMIRVDNEDEKGIRG